MHPVLDLPISFRETEICQNEVRGHFRLGLLDILFNHINQTTSPTSKQQKYRIKLWFSMIYSVRFQESFSVAFSRVKVIGRKSPNRKSPLKFVKSRKEVRRTKYRVPGWMCNDINNGNGPNIRKPWGLWSSPWNKWPAVISRIFLNWPSLLYKTHFSAE